MTSCYSRNICLYFLELILTYDMDWSVPLLLSINFVVIFTHLLALTLLFKLKVGNLNRSQKYLLISLCLTELTLGIYSILISSITFINIEHTKTIEDILLIFLLTPLSLTYFLVMILITLDRLLEFRLSIKYHVYWSPKKTLVALLVIFSISISIFICIVILTRFYDFISKYEEILLIQVLPVFGNFFLVLAGYTYYQIYKKVKENREKSKRIKRKYEVKNSSKQIDSNQRKRLQVFLPSLIIGTFILFSLVPYLIWIIQYHICNNCYIFLTSIIEILYSLGLLADPVVYIFSLKPIRMRMKRALK